MKQCYSDHMADELTVDELARRTGMTVRNIRAHQSRGLLPPPQVRARTGYYGPEHVARLELIRELQGQGFNLEAIRRLLERSSGSNDDVMGFIGALREPFAGEDPEVVDLATLIERYGEAANPALLQRAIELGMVRQLPDGRFEQRSPRLAKIGVELNEAGIGPEAAVDLMGVVRGHADAVAQAYVKLFLDEIWEPFEAAGRPQERWPEIRASLERLRPLAAESLLGVFGVSMKDAIDEAFGQVLEQIREQEERADDVEAA
jgi:DNA-binding transcriptional MerR regulator